MEDSGGEVPAGDPTREPDRADGGEGERNQRKDRANRAERSPSEEKNRDDEPEIRDGSATDQRCRIRSPDHRLRKRKNNCRRPHVGRTWIMPRKVPFRGFQKRQSVDRQVAVEMVIAVEYQRNADQCRPRQGENQEKPRPSLRPSRRRTSCGLLGERNLIRPSATSSRGEKA